MNALTLFDENAGAIAAASPHRTFQLDRTRAGLYLALRQNEALSRCNPRSIVSALASIVQLGLDMTPAVGQAYLVPYRDNCQLQIGYKGMIALALNSGTVKAITAHAVYEADEFSFRYGTEPTLTHVPAIRDRGEMVCAYAVATLADGSREFRVATADDIAKARSFAQTKRSDSPWLVHPDEMARKTAIRRLCRDIVQSPTLQTALGLDDKVHSGFHFASDGQTIITEGEYVVDDAPSAPSTQATSTTARKPLKDRIAPEPAPAPVAAPEYNVKALRERLAGILADIGDAPSDLRAWIIDTTGKDVPPMAEWDGARLEWACKALTNGKQAAFLAWLAVPEMPPEPPGLNEYPRDRESEQDELPL